MKVSPLPKSSIALTVATCVFVGVPGEAARPSRFSRLNILAVEDGARNRWIDAEKHMIQGLHEAERLGPNYRMSLALLNLCAIYTNLCQRSQLQKAIQRLIQNESAIAGGDRLPLIPALEAAVRELDRQNLRAEAIVLRRKIASINRQAFGSGHVNTVDSLNDLAMALTRLGKPKESELVLRELVGTVSLRDRPRYLLPLSESLMQQGRQTEAIALLSPLPDALTKSPSRSQIRKSRAVGIRAIIQLRLARLYTEVNDFARARELMNDALPMILKSGNVSLQKVAVEELRSLADACVQQRQLGNAETAFGELSRLLAVLPKQKAYAPDALVDLACFFIRQRQHGSLEQLARRYPEVEFSLYDQCAVRLVSEDRYNDALRVLRKAEVLARASGHQVRLTFNLVNQAKTLARLGRHREALSYFRQALPHMLTMSQQELIQETADCLIWYIRSLAYCHEYAEARLNYGRLQEIDKRLNHPESIARYKKDLQTLLTP